MITMKLNHALTPVVRWSTELPEDQPRELGLGEMFGERFLTKQTDSEESTLD